MSSLESYRTLARRFHNEERISGDDWVFWRERLGLWPASTASDAQL
jgi:hypothetical protein